ncbi:flavin-containing monooxygenase [Xanthobacter aminoxidans]|uniref:flavin-containing monooxygenase n=1 Tax=Xanthobacter aminoxidans TaxID=186280 RepID=UPI00202308CF|nr:NAD(P)/FAD-dependent oxidoreductase [Xanthobacter aminoxidans]MCL8385785.1 NAD(P)/FAD-dependent oxidoreductase [Xanthobacter aminoxidans]
MTQSAATPEAVSAETFDVIIVGAGISGIGSAWYLDRDCPGKSFVILEAMETFGGTWHTHRYPGVRSDSDLYTFGYSFKPWTEQPVATADRILTYLGAVIAENGIDRHIRYRHHILSASWSSAEKFWTLKVRRGDTGETLTFRASFLWMCQGYYRHSEGYTPEWEGMADYEGRIVHPQTWPEDLDYTGRRVAIIGSGATAATIVPAMADTAAHITLIQRSPTYFNPGTNADPLADQLRALEIDEHWIHAIVRKKLLEEQKGRIHRAQNEPEAVAREMLAAVAAHLGPDVDLKTHFTPRYRPWQQRVAFIPEGDFFQPFKTGKASVVTDQIERFTPKGIRVKSGQEVEADIVVTATGFNLCVLGDIAFDLDGAPLDLAETVTYQGMMFTGVPNMVWVFGYFRASWTLRVEMIAEVVCRMLQHMDAMGAKEVTVEIPPELSGWQPLPWVDPENFNPNYLMRDMHLMPKRLDLPDWQHTQDYWSEKDRFAAIDVANPVFHYE